MWNRIRYFIWAARKSLSADKSCPACGNEDTRHLRRKWLVTSLRECSSCGIRFRLPKGYPESADDYYESRYELGVVTTLPDEKELKELIDSSFSDHEKDYSAYIEVLRSAGLSEGATIFDFGCSWGYGSWQLKRAGFSVIGYEISPTRARFAAEKLGIQMTDSPQELRGPVDCFFSSHVIEHLADPNDLWRAASRALRPGGFLVSFTPNGNPAFEQIVSNDLYRKQWGQSHPVLITSAYLVHAAASHGFRACVYSSPYNSALIASGQSDEKALGDELCIVAEKVHA